MAVLVYSLKITGGGEQPKVPWSQGFLFVVRLSTAEQPSVYIVPTDKVRGYRVYVNAEDVQREKPPPRFCWFPMA